MRLPWLNAPNKVLGGYLVFCNTQQLAAFLALAAEQPQQASHNLAASSAFTCDSAIE
jgi:hypothetical protein